VKHPRGSMWIKSMGSIHMTCSQYKVQQTSTATDVSLT
jgi:hypothetical protein